jgi:hypothetical protein
MSTDLVVLNNPETSVSVYEDHSADTGLDSIRVRMTHLTLVQNTTRDSKGARPGQILDVLTEEAYEEITVVPLQIIRPRVLFPPNSDLEAEPLCRSNDGLVPAPNVKNPMSNSCKSCRYSQWVNGKRPPCDAKIQLALIIKESNLPRYFSAGGKSITAINDKFEVIRQDMIKKKSMKGLSLNLYDYAFTLSGDRVNGKQGSYYVARISKIEQISEPGKFREAFVQYILSRKYDEQVAGEVNAADNAEQAVNNAVDNAIDAEVVNVEI